MSTIDQRAAIAEAAARSKTPTGLAYTDRSVVALTARQAAGQDPVLAANAQRRGLRIEPPAACALALAAGAVRGVPLAGGVSNGSFVGGACPSNAIYLIGLAAGASVVIWEA